jgi:hypothetical protein
MFNYVFLSASKHYVWIFLLFFKMWLKFKTLILANFFAQSVWEDYFTFIYTHHWEVLESKVSIGT